MQITKWLERLQRWIRTLIRGKSQQRTSPRIVKRWYGNQCAVLRLERDTKGGVSTYRITSLYAECDYLLTLDYLPELQAELVGEYNGTPFHLRHLYHPHNTALTHRFAIFRVWRNGISHPIGIWDVDLQGFVSNSALRELAPKRAIAAVALQTLNILHSTHSLEQSWQAQVERLDWLDLLETRIRQELSSPSHRIKACVISQEVQS